jgi:hypothetical protein
MTDLTLINAALTRMGEEPLTTLDTGGVPATIATQNYELLIKSELSLNPWKKATKIVQLARLDEDEEGEPPEPWTAAYQLPTDLVEIRTVKVAGLVIDYEWHGDTLVCDAGEDDEVILHYVWRIPESWFPPWLKEGVIRRLEAIFLRGITHDYDTAKDRDAAAEGQFAMARNRDAQSQTPRAAFTSPTLAARGR